MRRGKFAILILAALAATPAASAPTTPARPSADIPRDPVAVLDVEMRRYGQWLTRVMEIEGRVQQQLMGLQPAWRQAMDSPRAEGMRLMRAYIGNALAVIDAADTEIVATTAPEVPNLDLEEDLLPAAIVPQVRRLNRDIRAVVAGYLPLLDTFSRPEGTEVAAQNLIGNLRLVFESQLVLLRAAQTTTPREDADWEITGFQISFLRAAERIFRAFDPMRPRLDTALPADLLAIADELDTAVRRADEKLAESIARLDNLVAEAERMADISSAAVLRRSRAVIAIGQDNLPLARQLSVSLRRGAAAMRGRPVTSELLIEIFAPLRTIRVGFDEVALRQSRALAENP